MREVGPMRSGLVRSVAVLAMVLALPAASQDGGNHIHTVWRDFAGDFGRSLAVSAFGRDLLRDHYVAATGTSHRH